MSAADPEPRPDADPERRSDATPERRSDATPEPGREAAPATSHETVAVAPAAPAMRVGDAERDAAAQRLQQAFAERRLDDDEFDERMRAALTARTSADLDKLTADLPAPAGAAAASDRPATPPSRGGWVMAYKNSVRRAGRWRVPAHLTTVIYKGNGHLDLRAAELTAPVTMMTVVAYKSRVDVLVPPGVRVEMDGFGVSKGWSEDEAGEVALPPSAPTVRVRGVAYKGTIETRTKPAGPGSQPSTVPISGPGPGPAVR
jgi:hypothetical protein